MAQRSRAPYEAWLGSPAHSGVSCPAPVAYRARRSAGGRAVRVGRQPIRYRSSSECVPLVSPLPHLHPATVGAALLTAPFGSFSSRRRADARDEAGREPTRACFGTRLVQSSGSVARSARRARRACTETRGNAGNARRAAPRRSSIRAVAASHPGRATAQGRDDGLPGVQRDALHHVMGAAAPLHCTHCAA